MQSFENKKKERGGGEEGVTNQITPKKVKTSSEASGDKLQIRFLTESKI